MDTQSTNNIVPFKIVANNDESPKNLSEEQQATYDAVLQFAKFLVDNADKVDHFVAAVAVAEDKGMAMHVVTPPIHANDFAFALKKLEHTFFNNLSNMGSPL